MSNEDYSGSNEVHAIQITEVLSEEFLPLPLSSSLTHPCDRNVVIAIASFSLFHQTVHVTTTISPCVSGISGSNLLPYASFFFRRSQPLKVNATKII
jgi:hypothetical protein